MRVAIVINPISGRRSQRAHHRPDREAYARDWLSTRGIDADVAVTARAGHAVEIARSFVSRGFDRIIAWGGDGTANEVAGPLIGNRTTLGLVRSGSGDGFARGLGLPAEPDRALDIAVGATVRRLDVGTLGPRHFLNVGGVGFDAAVARAFNATAGRGLSTYVSIGLSSVWGYRSMHYELELDGASMAGERLLVAFANGPQYGNGFVLAPDADPSDGWLNVVIVEAGPPLRQLWRARRLLLAPGQPAAGVTRARVTAARIAAESMQCHVDGEAFDAHGTLDVTIAGGAIGIAVPEV